jgi:hypothetical protein
MTQVEEDKLLKLKGTSSSNHSILLAQSDTLSSSLLWHARFGHINYDSIKL